MTLFLAGLAVIVCAGTLSLLTQSFHRLSMITGGLGVSVGSAIWVIPACQSLFQNKTLAVQWAWGMPQGSLILEIDPLSAFFLLPIAILCLLAALYAMGYLRGQKKTVGAHWFFYSLLAGGMALVVTARNGLLFLIAWELMSVASYFLVTFEDEEPGVIEAGRTYLIATHIGTAFLFVLFVLLGQESGSLDFAHFTLPHASPWWAGTLFLLALIGFGTKAGLVPLHVWLPEAHPAAPSHVSALMSGVMIKTGIYGILRILPYIGTPPAWWGMLLIGLGLLSGLFGILSALAQTDIKRALAYSSVENIGIIALGLGICLIGQAAGAPLVALLGLAGALLHVLNHACFKGLLFLGAGSVLHGTGTKNMERLGGLMKTMPWTGTLFTLGALAISALPPFNGFLSEWLIYLGALHGQDLDTASLIIPLFLGIAGLALIGGLALACFTKLVGIVFLGEPRDPMVHAHEAHILMRLPMLLLAIGCLAIGLAAPWVLALLQPVLSAHLDVVPDVVSTQLQPAAAWLAYLPWLALGLFSLMTALASLRWGLLRQRTTAQAGTWDCGYTRPTARMQYSGSAFSQPILLYVQRILQKGNLRIPQGFFPTAASWNEEAADPVQRFLVRPAYECLVWSTAKLRWIQHGRLQWYVLYIALTLVVLLIWKFR